jgi:hypothetical protein
MRESDFSFGPHARGWLIDVYRLTVEQIERVENAVRLDMENAAAERRASCRRRPPSRAALLKGEARRLLREAAREARR